MKLSQFKFSISDSLLATHPSNNRDESRLMVVDRATGKIEHKVFKDIIDYFGEDDVLITNNTKVFPARLYGNKEKTEYHHKNTNEQFIDQTITGNLRKQGHQYNQTNTPNNYGHEG